MLEYLSGPLIGAAIGYCTNYIAVKMLFYPRNEIRIWGHNLPFTPGAIPKGKPRLAKGIGTIVANTLLTEEDIRNKILTPETEKVVVDRIMQVLSADIHSNAVKLLGDEERFDFYKEMVTCKLTQQVMDSLMNINLGEILVQESERVIKEKVQGTMLAMFLSEEMLASFIQPIGEEIAAYIAENGSAYIQPEIADKIDRLTDQSIMDLCEQINLENEQVRGKVVSLYQQVVETFVSNMMKQLNVQDMIEEKINQMSIVDLEKMVLTIMKKELDTIVNLGALVGGVLGAVNIFI